MFVASESEMLLFPSELDAGEVLSPSSRSSMKWDGQSGIFQVEFAHEIPWSQ